MNKETKVGLFLLIALTAILSSILFLGNVQIFKRTNRYHIDFENVEALPPKAAVKIAGVEIGKVRKVSLIGGHARVTIDVDPKVPVYKNAVARVGSTGIIGTKFVELNPGTSDVPLLQDGEIIAGVNGGDINAIFNKLGALFENDPKHGDAIANVKESIANIRNVTRALNVAMGQHAQEMEEIVMNVRDLTANFKVFSAHLEEISTERKDDIKVAIEKFRSVGEKLDALLAKVENGEGMLGTLVSDEKAGRDLKEAVASVKDTAVSAKKVLGRFTNIHTYWNYRYRYDFVDETSKSDLGIKFVPRPGKFYFIGANYLGDPPSNEKHTQYERKNRITAVMGQDLGPLTGYAGVIRADGGFGLNIRPFWFLPKINRRFEITSEAADFDRDRVVNGQLLDKPWVSVGAHAAVTKWLWIGARWEDIVERSAFMAYTNVIFSDEDLAYLLGFASFAR